MRRSLLLRRVDRADVDAADRDPDEVGSGGRSGRGNEWWAHDVRATRGSALGELRTHPARHVDERRRRVPRSRPLHVRCHGVRPARLRSRIRTRRDVVADVNGLGCVGPPPTRHGLGRRDARSSLVASRLARRRPRVGRSSRRQWARRLPRSGRRRRRRQVRGARLEARAGVERRLLARLEQKPPRLEDAFAPDAPRREARQEAAHPSISSR
jgi:hypothetical protein